MHALVLRLVHQGADPALVVAHPAQALQVVDGRADHAGNGRDGLQHDRAMPVALGEEGVGAEAQRLGEAISDAVRHTLGIMMDAKVDNRSTHFTLHHAATAPRGSSLKNMPS